MKLFFFIYLLPALLACLFIYLSWKIFSDRVYPRPALFALLILGLLVPTAGYLAPLMLVIPMFDSDSWDYNDTQLKKLLFPKER